jgi:uncharacterized protein YggE
MKKIFLTALLFAAVQTSVQSQTALPKSELPYIEVTGHAEKEVAPDIIYVNINLSDKITSKGSEYTIGDQESRLKKLVADLNIDAANLVLANASTSAIIKKEKEKGVAQRKEYMLKLTSAGQVNQLFEGLYNNDIKDARITKVDHTRIVEFNKETRISAIKAAKDKAIYLLEAIGEQIGKPLEVTEQGQIGYNSAFANTVSLSNSYSIGGGNEDNLEFKKIKIVFEYFIKYSIK